MRFLIFIIPLFFSSPLFSQVTLSQNFDSFTTSQLISDEDTIFIPKYGGGMPASIGTISNSYSFSPPNSLEISATPFNLAYDFGKILNTDRVKSGIIEWSTRIRYIGDEEFNLSMSLSDDPLYSTNNPTAHTYITMKDNFIMIQDASKFKSPRITVDYSDWIKLTIKGNIGNGKWEYYLDDNLIYIQQTERTEVAFLNLRPLSSQFNLPPVSSELFLDDITCTYTPTTETNNSGTIYYLDIRNGFNGVERKVKFRFKNYSSGPINSIKAAFNYKTYSFEETFNFSSPLQPGEIEHVEFTDDFVIQSGQDYATVLLKEVDGTPDMVTHDDTAFVYINPILKAEDKVILIEEATATWCSTCSGGHTYAKRFEEIYGPAVAVIAIHYSDPMSTPVYSGSINNIVTAFPRFIPDRKDEEVLPTSERGLRDRLMVPSKTLFDIGALYYPSTDSIKVSVRQILKQDISPNSKLNVVISENGVSGTSSGYDQSNGFSGEYGSYDEYNEWFHRPFTVPAAEMVYNHVARKLLSESFGGIQPFTTTHSAGDTILSTFSFKKNDDWNFDNLLVTSFIREDNDVDNALQVTIQEAIENGYEEESMDTTSTNVFVHEYNSNKMNVVYGNSAITISLDNDELIDVNIYDYQGKLMMKQNEYQTGTPISVETLTQGVYLIEARHKNHRWINKIIIP